MKLEGNIEWMADDLTKHEPYRIVPLTDNEIGIIHRSLGYLLSDFEKDKVLYNKVFYSILKDTFKKFQDIWRHIVETVPYTEVRCQGTNPLDRQLGTVVFDDGHEADIHTDKEREDLDIKHRFFLDRQNKHTNKRRK
jgi:hypothetical protein